MNEHLSGMSVTTRRNTKLVTPVILVVVWFLGNRAKNRCYGPERATLWVAAGVQPGQGRALPQPTERAGTDQDPVTHVT